MKKRVNLTLSLEILEFLEKNFINKSAYIEALIVKNMHEQSINKNEKNTKETKDEIEKEISEVLQKGIA
jgi:uncharacterized protein YqgQ